MPFNSQELKYPRELKTWIKKKKNFLKSCLYAHSERTELNSLNLTVTGC